MPDSILVSHATSYGSTPEVAEAVAAAMRAGGLLVEVRPMREVRSLAEYRAVVLGAPLIMFHWHRDALRFLASHRQELQERPVAVFALGPTHEPRDEQEWLSARAQLDKELAAYPWFKPIVLEVFGGKYDPAALRFPLNLMAGKQPASDLRDWADIRAWGSGLAELLEPARTDRASKA